MIWPTILIFLLLSYIIVVVLYLSLSTDSHDAQKNTRKRLDDSDSNSSFSALDNETPECLTYDAFTDACEDVFKSCTSTEPVVTSEYTSVRDVPKVFRDNEYKSWYYLNRNKRLGYIRCEIFAHDFNDLLSLNDLMRSLGDIAYVKETNKFYIYMSNNRWEEYTEYNYDDLLSELDYMLAQEGKTDGTEEY